MCLPARSRFCRTSKRGHTGGQLTPSWGLHTPVPGLQVRTLRLIEGNRGNCAVDADLHQDVCGARGVGFRSHPLRSYGSRRPKNNHSLRRPQSLLDNIGIDAMRRQFVIAPDLIALGPQHFGHALRLRLIRPGVGDKYVRHYALSLIIRTFETSHCRPPD